MNEIEKMFYEALQKFPDFYLAYYFEPQAKIGPYKADFLIDTEYVIEIDGQEYHKTQAQREHDYQRERYLQARGYKIIRFTGREVYRDPERCVKELIMIHRLNCLRTLKRIETIRKLVSKKVEKCQTES